MDPVDDPDPGGWPVHPAVSFYGLWPRFVLAEDDAGESVAGEPDPVAGDG
jgi:hypothetical protein